MLKAFNPVAILLISFAFKIQEPNGRLIVIVLVSVVFSFPLLAACCLIARLLPAVMWDDLLMGCI